MTGERFEESVGDFCLSQFRLAKKNIHRAICCRTVFLAAMGWKPHKIRGIGVVNKLWIRVNNF